MLTTLTIYKSVWEAEALGIASRRQVVASFIMEFVGQLIIFWVPSSLPFSSLCLGTKFPSTSSSFSGSGNSRTSWPPMTLLALLKPWLTETWAKENARKRPKKTSETSKTSKMFKFCSPQPQLQLSVYAAASAAPPTKPPHRPKNREKKDNGILHSHRAAITLSNFPKRILVGRSHFAIGRLLDFQVGSLRCLIPPISCHRVRNVGLQKV